MEFPRPWSSGILRRENMRRRAWLCLAAASLAVTLVRAESRPRYGGLLRVAVRERLLTYEPVAGSALDDATTLRRQIALLVFDRLTRLDAHGAAQPALATSWEHDADLRRWVFHLRPAVRLHDGAALTA